MLRPVVFFSGGATMVLELLASRLLAPYLGTSLYVWTSVIGVVLGSLSVGYWWGGRLADQRPEPRVLSLILLVAGCAVCLIPAVQGPFLAALSSSGDPRWNAVAASGLFVLPAALLGMVVPFAARLELTGLKDTGKTVGSLYAISTLGSIAGTFAAGFWLIPTFGSSRLVLGVAAALMVCSGLVSPLALRWPRTGALLLLCAAAAWGGGTPRLPSGHVVEDRDTAYQRLLVFDLPIPNRLPVRVLSMGFGEYHSAMLLDRPEALALNYTRFFRLAALWRPGLRRALCIGGGAFSYPRDLLRSSPGTRIDVVELDPEVTAIARRHFGLVADSRLAIHHEDGRVFLNRDGPRYDAVFLDVFWGRAIPFHLATVESARRIAARLTPEGVLLVNLVSAIEGPNGRFFRAEYATLRQLFPQVLVFATLYPDQPQRVQNLVLAATRSSTPLPLEGEAPRPYAGHLWQGGIPSDEPVLTDDFAPVEQYAASQLRDEPAP